MVKKKVTFKFGPRQEAWLNALTSGKFKQTREALEKIYPNTQEHSYCCLGVAGKVAISRGCRIPYRTTRDAKGEFDSMEYSLSPKLLAYFGIQQEDAQNILMDYNDNAGLSFKQIASRIKANPTKFFESSK